MTLLRLEGIAASVADRAGSLGKVLATMGAEETLQDDASAAVWAAVRDVDPFAASGARGLWPVWRIVCPPASGGALGQMLARKSQGDVIYDWGGGLIWAAVPQQPDALAGPIRQEVEAAGGHATLIRASEEVRRNVDVFHPQGSGVAALGQRVRHSFDPKIILKHNQKTRTTTTRKPKKHTPNWPIPISRKPTRSCAPAGIAASAPRPVRPMCCSATNSIARAGGST